MNRQHEARACRNRHCRVEFSPLHGNRQYCTPRCYEARQNQTLHKREHRSLLNQRLHRKFGVLCRHARQRGIENVLNLTEYGLLVEDASCHWCGGSLPLIGHGLDRLDSTKGYSIANCVPSCEACNLGRRDMTPDEFRAWIKRVYERQFSSDQVTRLVSAQTTNENLGASKPAA